MNRRLVPGNPVLAEDIEKAQIVHDDIVKEVIEGFKSRQLVQGKYVEYVMDALNRTGKYPELSESLNSLVQDRTTTTVQYAHDPEIEKSRIFDLGITYPDSDEPIGWDKVFSRCFESVEKSEVIQGVPWPFMPLLIFECMFVGERLNPAFRGKTLDEVERIFLEEFSWRYSHLTGKKVQFKPHDEDVRHNNRIMYAWADKHCPPLVDRGISYVETLESISPERLDKFIESVYGSVGGQDRVLYKDGYEYFLKEGTLYKRALSESEKVFVEVKSQTTLEEALTYIEEHESRLLQEARNWWGQLSVFDKIHLREQQSLSAELWDAMSLEDKKSVVELYKTRV